MVGNGHMNTRADNRISRRQFVLGCGAINTALAVFGLAGVVGAFEHTDQTFEKYMALAEKLTGSQPLDTDLGRQYFEHIRQNPKDAALLEKLLENDTTPSADEKLLKQSILRQWYTGISKSGQDEQVVAFEQALMWNSLGFEQPIGTCRGDTGYWSIEPA